MEKPTLAQKTLLVINPATIEDIGRVDWIIDSSNVSGESFDATTASVKLGTIR
jgi:hypothetical protein